MAAPPTIPNPVASDNASQRKALPPLLLVVAVFFLFGGIPN
jgi:hypothetical protein